MNIVPKNGKNVNDQTENADGSLNRQVDDQGEFDYSYVKNPARIALYDDMLSAPRITEIPPAPTLEFIENLASTVYSQARDAGGTVPYTVIREVTENFIHARFLEIIVSILDGGNTIRFADQGPGIEQKDKAQLPGYSSATEPMKRYIRGVGSGLPIVKEYMEISHGTITIEDNIKAGSVITISMKPKESAEKKNEQIVRHQIPTPPLNQREKDFLSLFLSEGALGVTDLYRLTGVPQSSTHSELTKLEQAGLIEKVAGQKRILTELGYEVARSL